MDDLTEEQGERSERRTIHTLISDQNREIKKWNAIARMVDPNPEVLPFALSTTEPERQWAFFARASEIVHPPITREIDEVTEISDVVVTIF
ncbi:MAG: hypothetical protein NTV68_10705 [Methanomicrobiales archaeon]|nr:hypothetical protein [Methanomicrobiales archaeon]